MISIIIPSLKGDTNELEKELKNISINQEIEIIVIKNVSPVAKARNQGAVQSKGDILIFLDDDIEFSSTELIDKISETILKELTSGVVGVGLMLPKNATWFEKRLAKEINRIEIIPPKDLTQTDDGITGVCFGIKKETFLEIGGFNEELVSGEDPEFFYRLTKRGLKNYLLPSMYVYHHAPKNIPGLIKKFYWYGKGHYQSRHLHPEWGIGLKIENSSQAILYVLIRTLLLPVHFFIDSSFKTKKITVSFRPFRAISSYAAVWGYTRAFFNHQSNNI